MRFFRIYRKKKMKDPVRTLRIDGVKTTITPKPDDAELATQALLESMTEEGRGKKEEGKEKQNYPRTSAPSHLRTPDTKDASYYHNLSERIKAAHEHDCRAAMRYVAYVEAQLKMYEVRGKMDDKHQPSDISPLPSLERGLYQHQDTIEREGGELKRRWQKCLAELTVMEMESLAATADDQETNNEENKTN